MGKIFLVFHYLLRKNSFKHEVKGIDTVIHWEVAQNENTFTVQMMGTVLINPFAN